MITEYTQIDGWTDFEPLYQEVVDTAPEGAVLVEVGSWLGRSAAAMCTAIRKSKKRLTFFCVDTWLGTQNGEEAVWCRGIVQDLGGDAFPKFHENMEHWRGLYYPLRMTSHRASELFLDKSAYFVFLDAEHSVEALTDDIACWQPKVAPGGILAGHDISWESVREVVDRAFPWKLVCGDSWRALL
jgi:hypothetical protein